MTQNTSSAVMQQRAAAPDALDYFPTPPWATRALCQFLQDHLGEELACLNVWEPACGEGHMVRPLRERFAAVLGSDVHRYDDEHALFDFLEPQPADGTDWIITNPPFMLGQQFIQTALPRARRGVAMLVRSAFTESEERHALFRDSPPSLVLQHCERVVMLRGRLIQAGKPDPFNLDEKTGLPRKASTATSYSWIIWQPGQADTRHRWIAPCRRQLERPGDYPAYPEQWAKLAAPNQGGLL